jgi:hypothetical protein
MRCVHTRSEDRDFVDGDGHRNLPVTDANMRDIIEQRRLRSNGAAFHDRDPGSGHKFDSESQGSEGIHVQWSLVVAVACQKHCEFEVLCAMVVAQRNLKFVGSASV